MKVTLHLGAHKTASSYLQRTFASNISTLHRSGIGFVSPNVLREKVTKPLSWVRNAAKRTPKSEKIRDDAFTFLKWATSERKLKNTDFVQRHLLLTDENLIGVPPEMVNSQTLYPTISGRLELLSPMLEEFPPRIFFALRNPVSYAPSIFCEALLSVYPSDFNLRRFRKGWLKNAPRWSCVIESIRDTFPESDIHVWDFADFRALEHEIIHRITDIPHDVDFKPLERIIRPSMTDKAARKLMWLDRWRGNEVRFESVSEMRELYADGPKLKIWSDSEKAKLDKEYVEDLERIAAIERVTFLRPKGI